jgi:hypothetical protein
MMEEKNSKPYNGMVKQCPKSPSGYHSIRMGPEEVHEYIKKEIRKGRRYEEVKKETEDCQFCIFCGEAIW